MKLNEFRKMFKGLPADTEVMLVADWMVYSESGHPLLCDANAIGITCDSPQGPFDDGCTIVYIYNNPEKEYND